MNKTTSPCVRNSTNFYGTMCSCTIRYAFFPVKSIILRVKQNAPSDDGALYSYCCLPIRAEAVATLQCVLAAGGRLERKLRDCGSAPGTGPVSLEHLSRRAVVGSAVALLAVAVATPEGV